MFKRGFKKLLSLNLLNMKFHPSRKKKNSTDMRFRIEEEGSYVKEYYLPFEEAKWALNVNKNNIILSNKDDGIVLSFPNETKCIICE